MLNEASSVDISGAGSAPYSAPNSATSFVPTSVSTSGANSAPISAPVQHPFLRSAVELQDGEIPNSAVPSGSIGTASFVAASSGALYSVPPSSVSASSGALYSVPPSSVSASSVSASFGAPAFEDSSGSALSPVAASQPVQPIQPVTQALWQPRGASLGEAPDGLPRLIWEVLSARGFSSIDAIQKWLKPSLKDLRDPHRLTDMEKAVARLAEARDKQEPIVIYADYDLDGTSGLALLLRAFKWMGFADVTYYQPRRLTEGYGLHNEAIQRLFDQGRRLLLSVDLGITAIEEVRFARELGMEVIVTDHHLPKETLPDAFAVVNPNRGNCSSGLNHLCGTGVAFYLVLALRRALLERGVLQEPFDPKLLLDCFTIGTVTDMVPLIDENRVLVKHGLVQLAQTQRPGLRVLLQALGLWGNQLTSQDVAIRFAPKLNALSRMEMGVQPIDLYLVEDENEAHRLVEIVLSNNQARQASQKSAEAEAVELLREQPPGHAIFVYSRLFHKGVVGLVATKLSQEFGLPTFVGSLSDSGSIVGSARMPDGCGINVLDAMGFAHSALEQFGGHAAAAGFELKESNSALFRQKLEEFFAQRAAQPTEKVSLYDAEAKLSDFNFSFMAWHEHLSPFGMQFPSPVFLLRGVGVQQAKVLKGGHMRLSLCDFDRASGAAVWFSPPKANPLAQVDLTTVGRVDVLVEPQWNHFGGKKTIQLLIQDVRRSVG